MIRRPPRSTLFPYTNALPLTLTVPVKVPVRRDHEGDQMAVFGAAVFGVRLGDQVVGDRSWSHRGASECRVHRSSGSAGVRERGSSVGGGIVIAIVVELLLATVVPPSRLVVRCAPAAWRLMDLVWASDLGSMETSDFASEKFIKPSRDLNFPQRSSAGE